MKLLTILMPLIFVAMLMGFYQPETEKEQTVNPIIGDISFVHKFGQKPNKATDNTLRVKTHLAYVEGLLRQKDVSALPLEHQQKRAHLLDLLHSYWEKGIFPQNYEYKAQRKPCFIDKDGNICAVGYLIEQTAGREVAEKINSQFKYEALLDMRDKTIDEWVQASGLTKEEFAMIQPTYGPIGNPPGNYIKPAYGIASSVMGGLNASLGTINVLQISRGTKSKTVPIMGLITGAGQIVLGATNMPKNNFDFGINYTNESQKKLSMFNIGVGTANMILSAWNLITNRQPKNRKMAWNMYSFPTVGNNTGLAVGFVRKL